MFSQLSLLELKMISVGNSIDGFAHCPITVAVNHLWNVSSFVKLAPTSLVSMVSNHVDLSPAVHDDSCYDLRS